MTWIKSQGIVVSKLKYGNSSAICKVFTLESGLITLMVKGVYTPKKQGIKPALITPLNQVEITYLLKAHSNFAQLKSLQCTLPAHQTFLCSKKRMASALILEVVARCLTDQQPAPELFELFQNTLQSMEEPQALDPWFVHLFFIELAHTLGHTIQTHTYKPDYVFDILEGEFFPPTTGAPPSYRFNALASERLVALVSKQTPNDLKHRKTLLNLLIHFAHVHFLGSTPLRSTTIFNQIL